MKKLLPGITAALLLVLLYSCTKEEDDKTRPLPAQQTWSITSTSHQKTYNVVSVKRFDTGIYYRVIDGNRDTLVIRMASFPVLPISSEYTIMKKADEAEEMAIMLIDSTLGVKYYSEDGEAKAKIDYANGTMQIGIPEVWLLQSNSPEKVLFQANLKL